MSLRSALAGVMMFVVALLAPVSVAAAAPALSVSITHSPSTVNLGDGYMTYTATVENSGDAATTAPTDVTLSFPPGMSLNGGSGSSWTCYLTPKTCVYAGAAIPAGTPFPPLSIGVNLNPPELVAEPTLTVSAFGGGALSNGVGQDTFTLGPQLSFGIIPGSFTARAEDTLGADYTQAGGHPFQATTSFSMIKKKVNGGEIPFQNLRDGAINLPPGFVANPAALPSGCEIGQVVFGTCPEHFAIGRAYADLGPTTNGRDQEAVVYKIKAEYGYPAAFAFRPVTVSSVTIVVRPKIRAQDFAVTAFIPRPVQNPELHGLPYFTLCAYGAKVEKGEGISWTSPGCKGPTDTGALGTPFFTNPTRCNGSPDVTSIEVASYQYPGTFDDEGFPDLSDSDWKSTSTTSPELSGCNKLEFEPSFEGRPTTKVADAPTGLAFNLHIPQVGLVEADGLGSAQLKDTTVTLPAGMVVNPSAATGLDACTTEQMGLIQTDHALPYAIRFDGKPVRCPAASKIGTVTIESPLVEQILEGGVYLASQYENPFHSTLALYIVVRNEELGFSAKLAGKVTPDPTTGQLTAVFRENPQLPFEDLRLKFFEGPHASLRTPAICGTKTTRSTFTSWSEQTPAANRSDSFGITTGPGGPCATSTAQLPNAPRLSAGTVNPQAGTYSPFVLRVARGDGSQELQGIDATLPPGLTGRLAGVPYCPEADIAKAKSREVVREGAQEIADPSCPRASELGKVAVTAGAGPTPYHTGGTAYLAGPYKGAPISIVIIAPAVAGPFDLGNVVVRSALYVDPVTAQVSVHSDPIPHILDGIPLDVRSVEVSITRNQFTLNPTNCEPMSLAATAVGLTSSAPLSNRFQVGGCKGLAFKPKLKLILKGATKRTGHPALKAVLTAEPGVANIARAQVNLPHGEFLDQGNIDKACTKPVLLAGNCPARSVYGKAKAWTPLLEKPLEGNVYLVGGYGYKLPALVADLNGQVRVTLVGKVDSGKNKGIRNTFEVVPDAPVSRFVLEMKGGKKYGLLENSENLCKAKKARRRAIVRFAGQNGKVDNYKPVVRNSCRKHKKAGKRHKNHSGARHRRARR